MSTVTVDLHGYYPHDAALHELIERTVREAWEAGVEHVTFIHGHGLNRSLRRPFANTNTGVLGLDVRSELRGMRDYLFTKIDVSDPGVTTARVRPKRT